MRTATSIFLLVMIGLSQFAEVGARPRTAAAPLHQAMAIEHGMDSAFGREFGARWICPKPSLLSRAFFR